MNVLVAVDYAVARSGPHRHVVGSLNALSRRPEVQVRLLTGEIDASEPYSRRLSNILLGFRPHSLRHLSGNLFRFARAAKEAEIIYVPSGLKTFLYAQLFRRGRKLIAGPNVTGIPPRTVVPHPAMISQMCDAWIEASQFRKTLLINQGASFQHITVIPHALDPRFFSPDKRQPEIWTAYGLSPSRPKILFVSSDVSLPLKGAVHLLDAFRSQEKEWKEWDLVLVGQDKAGLINQYSKTKAIHFLGPKFGEELARLYASSDIFIMSSQVESFSFVVLEAMASGLAVIGNAQGSIPELIEHGKSGILVELSDERFTFYPDASTRLAAAIHELIQNPAQRQALGRSARQRILERFSEERLGQNLVALFQAVLQNQRQA